MTPALPRTEIDDRFHRFLFDLGANDASESSDSELARLRRLELLVERFDVGSLPRLPTILPQLLRMLKAGRSGGQIARMISRDPQMVGEIMRVASSSFYRTAQPIHSVQHAVVLIGEVQLRRILAQYAMKPILRATRSGFGASAGEHLWNHAECCAHAAAALGKIHGCDTFEAYLAGIVSHTGTGAIARLLEQTGPMSLPPSPPFLASCIAFSARITVQAAKYWELPEHVVEAVVEQQDSASPPRSKLGRTLCVADSLAMVQVLEEHGRLPVGTDLGQNWPEWFAAPVIQRCQDDLRQHFPATEDGPP